MSEQEHQRWVDLKLAAGWKHGPITDNMKKRHPSRLPWAEPSDEEKEKDHNMVRRIPQVLAKAGYAIVKAS